MEIHSPQSYLDRAQRLLSQNQISDAYRCVKKALEIDPDFAPGLLEMGKILEQNNQLDDSLSCYEQALNLDPHLWECQWRMGIIYDRKGLAALALQNFQTVMTKVPDLFPAEEHLKLAKAFLEQHNPRAAIEASKFCNTLLTALQVRTQAHIMLEEIDQGADVLAEIYHLDPAFNVALEYTNLAKIALKNQQIDRGQSFLQTALSLQPDLVEAHFYLALSFATIGKYREAFLSFQELVSIDAAYAPAYYEMGILATKLSKWEEAEAFFKCGRALNSNIYPQVQPLIDRVNANLGK